MGLRQAAPGCVSRLGNADQKVGGRAPYADVLDFHSFLAET